MDSELPKIRKSSTASEDPTRLKPTTEIAEPKRDMDLRDNELPIVAQSNTDSVDPQWAP